MTQLWSELTPEQIAIPALPELRPQAVDEKPLHQLISLAPLCVEFDVPDYLILEITDFLEFVGFFHWETAEKTIRRVAGSWPMDSWVGFKLKLISPPVDVLGWNCVPSASVIYLPEEMVLRIRDRVSGRVPLPLVFAASSREGDPLCPPHWAGFSPPVPEGSAYQARKRKEWCFQEEIQ